MGGGNTLEDYKKGVIEPGRDVIRVDPSLKDIPGTGIGSRSKVFQVGEITTAIDKAYDYIIERETVSLDELSSHMGIEKRQIEKMVDILERSQLVELKHSLIPGENSATWVTKKNKGERRIAESDKDERLKRTIREDMGRIEDALTSIEHHLNTWSSEVEETASFSNGKQKSLLKTKKASKEIQKNLELVMLQVNSRVDLLNSRLSSIRSTVGKNGDDEETEKPRSPFLRNLIPIPNPAYPQWQGVFGRSPVMENTIKAPLSNSLQTKRPGIGRLLDENGKIIAFITLPERRTSKEKRVKLRKSRWENEKRKDRRKATKKTPKSSRR